MQTKLYTAMVMTYVKLSEFRRQIERGDADSSGSTLRTVGIVVLIVAVILLLGTAVYTAAGGAANKINAATFQFGQ